MTSVLRGHSRAPVLLATHRHTIGVPLVWMTLLSSVRCALPSPRCVHVSDSFPEVFSCPVVLTGVAASTNSQFGLGLTSRHTPGQARRPEGHAAG